MSSNYDKPVLIDIGKVNVATLSSSGSSGKGKGDDNGEENGE